MFSSSGPVTSLGKALAIGMAGSLAGTRPTGTGLAAASLPMTIGRLLGGVLVSLLVVGALQRLVAVAGFAVATGLLITFVLQTWFEYLQGGFLVDALAIGLSVA